MFSLVLPTKNHPDFLERLLAYYRGANLKEQIFIADSSDENRIAAVRDVIGRCPSLNIKYRLFGPEISVAEKLAQILQEVDTEFVAPTADDDFFTTAGLKQAVDFLKSHPDYCVAHGHAIIFGVEPGPVYGDRLLTSRYTQRSIQHPSASERLLDNFTRYSTTWYSTHRTSNLASNMRKIADLQLDDAELLASGLCAAQGKTRKLNVLYMVRQAHGRKRVYLPDAFDWISNPEWAAQYALFETCLAEVLVLEDDIVAETARATVKQAFWKYVSIRLTKEWSFHHTPKTRSVAQLKSDLAPHAPWLVDAWQRVSSLLPGEDTQWLFPALLRRSSPYHQDFMPIYRAIARA
jgi:glycosyltransferase domain-containing protein